MSSTLNGIGTVELLESADPAAADAVRKRGRKPVVEINPGEPSVKNGIQGVILSDDTGGVGSVVRLDSGDPAEAEAARKRGQVPLVVVNEAGEPVAAGPPALAAIDLTTGGAVAVNGTSYTITDVFGASGVGGYPGTYNAAGVSAEGMTFAEGVNEPWLIGPLLAEVFGEKTYVLEFTMPDWIAGSSVLLHLTDEPNVNMFQINAYDLSSSGFANAPVKDFSSLYTDLGPQKLAVTLRDTGVSISLNGSAVLTDACSAIPAMTIAAIGHYPEGGYWGYHITSFSILSPVDDADLPALSALPAPEAPEWLPEGADFFLDPANGHYFVSGAEVEADDVFETPAHVTEGTGYVRPDTAMIAPAIIGDAADYFNTRTLTLVVDADFTFDATDGTGSVASIVCDDAVGGQNLTLGFSTFTSGDPGSYSAAQLDEVSAAYFDADVWWNAERVYDPPLDLLADPTRRVRIALTLKEDSLVLSVNGEAIITKTGGTRTVTPSPFTAIGIGDAIWQSHAKPITIRSITGYPPQDDADLPALSTL